VHVSLLAGVELHVDLVPGRGDGHHRRAGLHRRPDRRQDARNADTARPEHDRSKGEHARLAQTAIVLQLLDRAPGSVGEAVSARCVVVAECAQVAVQLGHVASAGHPEPELAPGGRRAVEKQRRVAVDGVEAPPAPDDVTGIGEPGEDATLAERGDLGRIGIADRAARLRLRGQCRPPDRRQRGGDARRLLRVASAAVSAARDRKAGGDHGRER
jgi:hypothetical protein